MYTKNTLTSLRQALLQRKALEDQVRQAIEPIKPTLRFIAELQVIYQEVYGAETETEISTESAPVSASSMKAKTKKEVLFTEAKVKLPENAKWQELSISFKNNEDVEVKYGDTIIGKYSHEDLGFAQANTEWKKPDRRWALLRMMSALLGREPNIPATKQHLMNVCGVTSPNAVEKRKSDLSMGLRQAFGINEEPFERYTNETGYQPKFTLLPEKELRGSGELRHSGAMDFEDEIYRND
ncbi:MAG: hypothetical protein H6779_02405 [Candidatus Nomurabacteria bacterium]|nr:MAG: hypothetical protein H6779_02405 [Candidatus Nomurabacteria bacterium]